jgi:glycosyl transferase family 2
MISCLCVTHARPEFLPWVKYQFDKQRRGAAELVIVSGASGISAGRTEAMKRAQGKFITWFDDDDWQHPGKLEMAMMVLGRPSAACAVGARHAYMYSIESGQASLYESTYEPIIFNSAVYRKNSVPQNFDPTKITGEDTEWCERWLKTRPSYVTLGEPTHAWLCHGRNIVNKANSRFFEEPNPIPFDPWEIAFLQNMRAGK